MPCPNDDKLASLATGRLGRIGRCAVLRHLASCDGCRSRYDTLAPLLRRTLHEVSGRRGHIHPAPSELRARIFNAIEEDRDRSKRRRERPLLRLVPAFAAAALLLAAVFLGARFLLRESPAVGKLSRDAGAVLVARGSERPVLQRSDSREILPGDIILVAPGGEGSFSLRELGHAAFKDSLVAVVGAPDSGPALHLIRGTLSIQGSMATPIRVSTGAQVPSVAGKAEIEVLPEDPALCMAKARRISARLTRPDGLALMRSARADEPKGSGTAPRVRVHSLQGEVSFSGGLPPITAGSQILFQADGNFQGPALVGAGSLPLSMNGGVLTPEERQTVPALLARRTDAFASLLSAAADSSLSGSDRGLAVWLLGELGDPSVIEGLSQLLDPDHDMPAEVRAAAVRSLSLLGGIDMVRLALDDEEPAVVDTAIQSLGRRFPALAEQALSRVVGEQMRPAYQWALAAAMLEELEYEVSLENTLSICRSGDPHAVRIGDRLLVLIGSEEARRELQTLLGSAGAERKTAMLQFMVDKSNPVSGAETIAQHALHERDYPNLRAAAISYLSKVSAESLLDELEGLLEEASGPARHAALVALLHLRSRTDIDVTHHDDAVRRILLSPTSRSDEVVTAMSLLGDEAHLFARFIGGGSSSAIRRQAIELAGKATLKAELAGLISATTDKDPALRKSAWSAWARIAPDQALAGIVARCTEDPDFDIEEFLLALERISGVHVQEPRSRLLLRIVEPLLAQSTNPALRAVLVRMLRSPETVELLVRILRNEREALAVRAAAAETLAGSADGPLVRTALREALASPHEALSSRIALALKARRSADAVPMGLGESLRGAPVHDYARAVVALLSPVDREEAHDLLLRGNPAATALLLKELPQEVLRRMPDAVLTVTRSEDAGIACLALQRLPAAPESAEAAALLLSSPDPFVRLAAEGALLLNGAALKSERLLDALHGAAATRHGSRIREFLDETSGPRALAERLLAEGPVSLGSRLLALAVQRDASRLASMAARSSSRDRLSSAGEFYDWRETRTLSAERRAAIENLTTGLVRADRVSAVDVLGEAGQRADVPRLLRAADDPDPEMQRAARRALIALLDRDCGLNDQQELSDLEGWWRQRAYALEVPVSR